MRFAPEDCPLQGRWVNGDGITPCRIMLVGEAPGREEDAKGKPFVGKSGKELTMYLSQFTGINRNNVYITNVVKVRPPNNRDPKPEEVEWFRPYLLEELDRVRPKVVAAVGRFAAEWFKGEHITLDKWHGIPFLSDLETFTVVVVPCYHPSYGLHDTRMMRFISEDFAKLGEVIRNGYPGEHAKEYAKQYVLLEDK
jgi:uracil-DNA glycosylase family 4